MHRLCSSIFLFWCKVAPGVDVGQLRSGFICSSMFELHGDSGCRFPSFGALWVHLNKLVPTVEMILFAIGLAIHLPQTHSYPDHAERWKTTFRPHSLKIYISHWFGKVGPRMPPRLGQHRIYSCSRVKAGPPSPRVPSPRIRRQG